MSKKIKEFNIIDIDGKIGSRIEIDCIKANLQKAFDYCKSVSNFGTGSYIFCVDTQEVYFWEQNTGWYDDSGNLVYPIN